MTSTRGSALALAFGAGLLVVGSAVSCARMPRTIPSRSIRLIVPTAPGGTMDIVARTLAQVLGPLIGAQVFIENKPGGNNNIGASYVAAPRPTATPCSSIRIHSPPTRACSRIRAMTP